MKKIFLLLLFPYLLSVQMEQGKIEGEGWLKNYDTALTEAVPEQRNVLVYFTGSDWCPPCKMLKHDLFDTAQFKKVSEDYTLLFVDIPRNKDLLTPVQMAHNTDLLKKYNKRGVFPLLVILDSTGTELDEYSGYSMNGEIQYHLNLLNKYRN